MLWRAMLMQIRSPNPEAPMSARPIVFEYQCRAVQSGPIRKRCEECGAEFRTHDYRQKFCDRRCMARQRTGAEAKALAQVTRICQNAQCGEAFIPRRYVQVYCSGPCQQEQREAERDRQARQVSAAPKRKRGYLIAPQGAPTCPVCGAQTLIGTDFLGRSTLDCARCGPQLMPVYRQA
jgi:hypothetical protein